MALGVPGRAFSEPFRAGSLFDHFALTLAPGERSEAVGPLYQRETRPDLNQWAVPPLISHTQYPGINGEEWDFLYPLFTYDRYGGESRWQFVQLLSVAGGKKQDDGNATRTSLFPFYFRQRSTDPTENYTSVVPFYGTLKHRLMRDEIHFVLFPIYSETRKKDVVTDNYLYPFFHLRHGDALRGWQFWPLLGTEHKEPTTRTNHFDTVETIGGHDKRFALWPLFTVEHNGRGTDNPEDYHAFLPFYSLSRSPKRDVSSYLWPLFNYTDDREQKYREWDFPWPLWVIARGEGKTITRFLPFYTYGHTATMDSEGWLWPVYTHRLQHSDTLARERTRFGLWLYSRLDERRIQAQTASRRVDVWPLATHFRGHDGSTRLQILAPFEPLVPSNKSIERNFSPLWSLWRAEYNATNGASSQSLLWNLYRRDTTPETRRTSLLLGLIQYRSTPEQTQWRLFFIPITKQKPRAP